MEILKEVGVEVVLIILSGIAAFLAREVSRYLGTLGEKAKSEEATGLLVILNSVIEYLVRGAEQYLSTDGAEKKAWVAARAREYADEYNIRVTDEQIEDLIEGVLNEIESGFGFGERTTQ